MLPVLPFIIGGALGAVAGVALNAYIGVFGQQCRSCTGHFCNEIF